MTVLSHLHAPSATRSARRGDSGCGRLVVGTDARCRVLPAGGEEAHELSQAEDVAAEVARRV